MACRQDYTAFYEREIAFRREMVYPPVVSLVNVIVRARTFAGAMADAGELAGRLRAAAAGRFHVLGPAPAPLGRLRGDYRAQILRRGQSRKAIRKAIEEAATGRPDLPSRLIVDIDPLNLL